MHLLVDDTGGLTEADNAQLHQKFGFNGRTEDLIRFAVRNLSYVSIEPHHTHWVVRLRPDSFSLLAFERTAEVLTLRKPPRIRIEQDLEDGRSSEVLGNLGDAIARLAYLRYDWSGEEITSRFIADPISPWRLSRVPSSPLAKAFRAWRSRGGKLTAKDMRRLFDDPLKADWLMVKVGDDGVPVPVTLPEYIWFWGDEDRAQLIGKPFANHPDEAYGKAVSEAFVRTQREQEPTFELVNTIVRLPDGTMHWARYNRLLLPWRNSAGETFVSSVSAIRVSRNATASVSR